MRHAGKVLVLATGFAGFAGAAVPSYDSYKSWLVACDNGLTCEAKGFEDGTSNNPDLRFDRAAGPQAATEVTLNAPFSASLGDLRVDGKPLRLDAATWKVNSRADFSTLSTGRPAAVAALIAQLRNGSKLQVGKDASIPLDGMVAALLRMDDRQGRVDSVTALIRKGPTAAASVPAPPPLPFVPPRNGGGELAATEGNRLIARTRASQAALIKREDCQADGDGEEQEAYALDARAALVFIPCAVGAYQGSSLVFIAPRAGGAATPFDGILPFEKDNGGTFQVTEPDYDPKTGTLSTFGKGRGLADCGLSAHWIWDGHQFRLSEAIFQGQCGGSGPGDWPTLYRTR